MIQMRLGFDVESIVRLQGRDRGGPKWSYRIARLQ